MSRVHAILFNGFIVAGNLFVMWAASRLDGVLGWASFFSSAGIIIGAMVIIAGLVFRLRASSVFESGGVRVLAIGAQGRLIGKGPYKFSRNPLYIGLVLLSLGAAFIFGTFVGLALTASHFVFWHLMLVLYEEKNLEAKFGADYKKYMEEVPRWF